jgi:uncharacterized protein YodC (DUF2158 family)
LTTHREAARKEKTLAKSIDETIWQESKKKFPKGAKVQLTVGGPLMAVNGYEEVGPHYRKIECQWFSGKKLETGYFAPEALVLKDGDGEEKQSS